MPEESPAYDPQAIEQEKPEPDQSIKDEDIRRQRLNDLKEVVEMKGGAGKRFLRRIMADAGIYLTSYTGNAMTNFNEGKKESARMIIADLEQVASKGDRADILL